MKKLATALTVLAIFLSSSVVGEDERLDDIKAFYRLPVLQRMAAFRSYNLSEQLDIFFYGNQVRHPPAQELAVCYALSGPPGARLLRERLAKSNTDLDVRDIALLLEEMQRYGTYDVRGDAIMMDRLENRIASMQDRGWQDTAVNFLKEIRTVSPRAVPEWNSCLKEPK